MEIRILLFILIALAMISVVTEIIQLLLINTRGSDKDEKERQQEIDEMVVATREKSSSIIHKATSLANKILANAELKGIGLVAKQKLDSGKIAHDYEHQVQQMEAAFSQKLSDITQMTRSHYDKFNQSLEAALNAHMQQNQQILTQKGTEYVQKADTVLNEFVSSMHAKIEQQLDREPTRARAEIADYKMHRIRVIDTHIVELLERTVQIALGKKLDLGSQSDMIYQALQEAKAENALS